MILRFIFSKKHGTGALVVSAMLDILTFALCVPYSETTDGTHFDTLLGMVAKRGRYLFQLFQVNIPIFWKTSIYEHLNSKLVLIFVHENQNKSVKKF